MDSIKHIEENPTPGMTGRIIGAIMNVILFNISAPEILHTVALAVIGTAFSAVTGALTTYAVQVILKRIGKGKSDHS